MPRQQQQLLREYAKSLAVEDDWRAWQDMEVGMELAAKMAELLTLIRGCEDAPIKAVDLQHADAATCAGHSMVHTRVHLFHLAVGALRVSRRHACSPCWAVFMSTRCQCPAVQEIWREMANLLVAGAEEQGSPAEQRLFRLKKMADSVRHQPSRSRDSL